jgi:hypothetical protein
VYVWVVIGVLEKGAEALDFVKVGHMSKIKLALEHAFNGPEWE